MRGHVPAQVKRVKSRAFAMGEALDGFGLLDEAQIGLEGSPAFRKAFFRFLIADGSADDDVVACSQFTGRSDLERIGGIVMKCPYQLLRMKGRESSSVIADRSLLYVAGCGTPVMPLRNSRWSVSRRAMDIEPHARR